MRRWKILINRRRLEVEYSDPTPPPNNDWLRKAIFYTHFLIYVWPFVESWK